MKKSTELFLIKSLRIMIYISATILLAAWLAGVYGCTYELTAKVIMPDAGQVSVPSDASPESDTSPAVDMEYPWLPDLSTGGTILGDGGIGGQYFLHVFQTENTCNDPVWYIPEDELLNMEVLPLNFANTMFHIKFGTLVWNDVEIINSKFTLIIPQYGYTVYVLGTFFANDTVEIKMDMKVCKSMNDPCTDLCHYKYVNRGKKYIDYPQLEDIMVQK